MRTPLVAGNWKMHKTLVGARELMSGLHDGLGAIDGIDKVEILICPPATLLFPMAKSVADSPIGMGGQDAHEAQEGAFTGELSAAMIKDTGASHVIIGHSERRHIYGETDDLLAGKVVASLEVGLTVIYCIGETLDQREAGQTEQILDRQLADGLTGDLSADRLVIAYEPVWAIGTGKTATPDQAQQVHAFVRSRLGDIFGAQAAEGMRILYGGSVKPGNAAGLLSQPDIDGALVGGACLVAKDFVAIIAAAVSTVRA